MSSLGHLDSLQVASMEESFRDRAAAFFGVDRPFRVVISESEKWGHDDGDWMRYTIELVARRRA